MVSHGMVYDGSFDQGSSIILIGLPIAWLVSEQTVDHDCLRKWCDTDLCFRTCSWKGGKLLTCFGNPALCLRWFQNPLLEGGELSTMIAAGPGMECRDEFGKPMYRNRRSVSQVTLTLVWMLLFFVLFTWELWKGMGDGNKMRSWWPFPGGSRRMKHGWFASWSLTVNDFVFNFYVMFC